MREETEKLEIIILTDHNQYLDLEFYKPNLLNKEKQQALKKWLILGHNKLTNNPGDSRKEGSA